MVDILSGLAVLDKAALGFVRGVKLANDFFIQQQQLQQNQQRIELQAKRDKAAVDQAAERTAIATRRLEIDEDMHDFAVKNAERAERVVNLTNEFFGQALAGYNVSGTPTERLTAGQQGIIQLLRDPKYSELPISVTTQVKQLIESSQVFRVPKLTQIVKDVDAEGKEVLYGLDSTRGLVPLKFSGKLADSVSKILEQAPNKWAEFVNKAGGVVRATADLWGKASKGQLMLNMAVQTDNPEEQAKAILRMVPELEKAYQDALGNLTGGIRTYQKYLDQQLRGVVTDKEARHRLIKEVTGFSPDEAQPTYDEDFFYQNMKAFLEKLSEAEGREINLYDIQRIKQAALEQLGEGDLYGQASLIRAEDKIKQEYLGPGAIFPERVGTRDQDTQETTLDPAEKRDPLAPAHSDRNLFEMGMTESMNPGFLEPDDPMDQTVMGWRETGTMTRREALLVKQIMLERQVGPEEAFNYLQKMQKLQAEQEKMGTVMNALQFFQQNLGAMGGLEEEGPSEMMMNR